MGRYWCLKPSLEINDLIISASLAKILCLGFLQPTNMNLEKKNHIFILGIQDIYFLSMFNVLESRIPPFNIAR